MRLIHTLLLCLALVPVGAQIPFDHLTTADGLSQSTVWKIVQDPKGFIWLATADGLNRYDGYSFTVFRHQPGQRGSLSGSNISTVHADRQGTIWVGARRGGLNRLRPDGETFDHFTRTADGLSIGQLNIACLAEDRQHLWIGTSDNGLLYYDYHSRQIRQWQDRRLGPVITALATDTDGTVWVGTNRGQLIPISAISPQRAVYTIPLTVSDGAHPRPITVIQRDHLGRMWVGTGGRGLFQFDRQQRFTRVFYDAHANQTINIITDVVDDKLGNLWVMTDFGALYFPQGNTEKPEFLLPDTNVEQSLSTHALKKAFCDADGNIWIGSWQGGANIHRAMPDLFTVISHQPRNPQSLLTAQVPGLASDPVGNLWIGSTKGLTQLSADRQTFRTFTHQNTALGSNDASTLLATPSGNILISTWTAGFTLYDCRTKTFSAITKVGGNNTVSVLATSRTGKLWLGTNDRQLVQFDEQTHRIEPIDLTPLNRFHVEYDITALLEDTSGNLWVGTYNSGLFRWNRPTGRVDYFVSDGKKGSLESNGITTLFQDRDKRLWVGTNGGGISCFEPARNQFNTLTTRQGLANNTIAGLLEDDDRALWLATNSGITRYDPQAKTLHNYDQRDGLVGREFLPNACTRLPSGELAFGSMQGLIIINPRRLRQRNQPPRVYLSELKLFNRTVSPTDSQAPMSKAVSDADQFVFTAEQSVFTLGFTAPSFLKSRNIRYAYQLDGFDNDWNYVEDQRSATYTNLPEGAYTFRVKAAIGNSAWGPVRSVSITILPPWYRTGWTYGLYTLLLLGILYTLRRIILIRERLKADVRIKEIEADKMKVLDAAKTSFFTNISHEFRTPLTLILTPLEKLIGDQRFDGPTAHRFQTIQRNAQLLLRLINQLLDLSKLETQSLIPDIARNDVVQFISRIVSNFDELAEAKRLSLRFSSNVDAFDGYFDPAIVEKIVYNLLSNAFKFTPEGGEVRVSLHLTLSHLDSTLTLQVTDTGVGIADAHLSHIFERFYQAGGQAKQKKLGSGIGLALTKELVELHRGYIGVDSVEQGGTTFTVNLPLHEQAFPPTWLAPDREGAVEAGLPMLPSFVVEAVAAQPVKSASVLLIVEDNDELRQYLHEQFSERYHVLTAANGQQALKLAQKHVPDLVISDWLMPEMEGTELCRTLKRNDKTSHIPFLLLTSRSANQSQLNAFDTGIDDYMTKPFNLSLLETKVKSLIQNRQLVRESYRKKMLAQPSAISLPPMEEQFINRITELIEKHLDNSDFDAEQLEEAMNLSRMQLYRKLRSLTTMSPTEFIRQVRLQRARQLLESGQFNVSEVAYQVGFNDPAYFSRCFKKAFGKAPNLIGREA